MLEFHLARQGNLCRNQIQQAIDNLKIGKTTIVIAHRLSTVENAEKIIVLKDGKIVESGTHDDLMSLEKSYFELYKNQFKDEIEPAKKKLPILKSQFALSEQKTSNFIEVAWYENKNWIKILLPFSWIYYRIITFNIKIWYLLCSLRTRRNYIF